MPKAISGIILKKSKGFDACKDRKPIIRQGENRKAIRQSFHFRGRTAPLVSHTISMVAIIQQHFTHILEVIFSRTMQCSSKMRWLTLFLILSTIQTYLCVDALQLCTFSALPTGKSLKASVVKGCILKNKRGRCLPLFCGSCAKVLPPMAKAQVGQPVRMSLPLLMLGMSSIEEPDSSSVGEQKKNAFDYEWTPQTFAIGVPALIGMIADPLLSLMDTGFVGRLGAVPLAALGACTSIFHLAFNAFRATTTATTTLVASALARHGCNEKENQEEAGIVIDTSLRLGLSIGVVVAMTLVFGWEGILKSMGISHDSAMLKPAKSYLRIRALAAPAVLLITVAEGAFRGYGDTRIPLLASFAAAATNAILDPLLMFPLRMHVGGAAAATAISQVGGAMVYWTFLTRRKMLPQNVANINSNDGKAEVVGQKAKTAPNRLKIILSILNANLAMMTKQGSLLLGWAYATARATRIGHYHVAAHQVALSFWLMFALILDGTAVSAQVLMSRCYSEYTSSNVASEIDPEMKSHKGRPRRAIHSLTWYMTKFAFIQGLLSTVAIFILGQVAPSVFTTDPLIRSYLNALIPPLAWQQLLVSFTLVMESLAVGGNKFRLLAFGTAISTYVAVVVLSGARSIVDIWSQGIVVLFLGRLSTAIIGVLDLNGAFDPIRRSLASGKLNFERKAKVQ